MADFNYEKELTPWENSGSEPPVGSREWSPGENPPADWFNWFWDGVQKCLVNIKTWINGHKDATTGVHGIAQANGVASLDANSRVVQPPAIHNLVDTTNHPVTGLTAGHVFRATGTNTYGFGALQIGDLPATFVKADGSVAMTGVLNLNSGGGALNLKAGSSDHVYMNFYADTQNPNTRSGYLGFGTAGGTELTISNLMSGIINMVATELQVNGSKVCTLATDGNGSGFEADKAYHLAVTTLTDAHTTSAGVYIISDTTLNSPQVGQWYTVRYEGDSNYGRLEANHLGDKIQFEKFLNNGTWGSWVQTRDARGYSLLPKMGYDFTFGTGNTRGQLYDGVNPYMGDIGQYFMVSGTVNGKPVYCAKKANSTRIQFNTTDGTTEMCDSGSSTNFTANCHFIL